MCVPTVVIGRSFKFGEVHLQASWSPSLVSSSKHFFPNQFFFTFYTSQFSTCQYLFVVLLLESPLNRPLVGRESAVASFKDMVIVAQEKRTPYPNNKIYRDFL